MGGQTQTWPYIPIYINYRFSLFQNILYFHQAIHEILAQCHSAEFHSAEWYSAEYQIICYTTINSAEWHSAKRCFVECHSYKCRSA